MKNYSTTQELSKKMEDGLTVFQLMLGPKNAKAMEDGFIPGLDMNQHCQVLQTYTEKLREGVFQLMFTGHFNSGKSTLINALLRKEILRMAITAETAVISKVIFGHKEKAVIVAKKTDPRTGKPERKEMTLKAFFELMRVSQTEPEKFTWVDHAVLYLEQEGIGGNTVQLVDSPGTNNSQADTEAAHSFAKTASAIVYLINATTPFVQEDKKYIAEHYANKQLQNLFFVINHIDSLSNDALHDLKEHSVPQQLRAVFTRKDGSFDSELFNQRVFYTNAYGSLQTRQGKPAARFMGQDFFMKDEDTGVPQFEDALEEFLTSDGRDKAAFQSYMPHLANMYLAAEAEIDRIMKRYSADLNKLTADKDKIQANAEKCRGILNAILDSCKIAVRRIIDDGRREYASTVNRIDAGWQKHFANSNLRFGIWKMVLIAANKIVSMMDEEKAKKQLEETMKPFSEAVNAYVASELKKMETTMSQNVRTRLTELDQDISRQAALLDALELPLSIADITDSLATAFHVTPVNAEKGVKNNTNLFQVLMGAIMLDPETAAAGISGTTSNGSAIVQTLAKNVVEFIAWYVVAWPIGIAMLVGRIVQMIRQGSAAGKNGAQQMLDGMRDAVVSDLRAKEDRFASGLEDKMAVILRAGNTMTGDIQSMLDDYTQKLDEAISAINGNASAAEVEKQRTGCIRDKLYETLSELYQLLYNEKLTPEKVRTLAVN